MYRIFRSPLDLITGAVFTVAGLALLVASLFFSEGLPPSFRDYRVVGFVVSLLVIAMGCSR